MPAISISQDEQILFSYKFDPGIFVYDLSSGELGHVTKGMTPCWSPDGNRIAFQSFQPLFMSDSFAGPNSLKYVDRQFGKDPSWSSDGSRIAYTYREYQRRAGLPFPEEREKIKIYSLASQRHEVIGDGQCPTWAPDGRRLAYSVDENELAVLDFQTRETKSYIVTMLKPVTGEAKREGEVRFFRDLAWSPAGDKLLYVAWERSLIILDLGRMLIQQCKGFRPWGAGWLPNGEEIAFIGHLDEQDPSNEQAGLYIYSVGKGSVRHIMYVMQ